MVLKKKKKIFLPIYCKQKVELHTSTLGHGLTSDLLLVSITKI